MANDDHLDKKFPFGFELPADPGANYPEGQGEVFVRVRANEWLQKEESRWPEVEVAISRDHNGDTYIIEGKGCCLLTRAQAEAVKRAYEAVVDVAKKGGDQPGQYRPIGKDLARRILKGE